MTKRYVYLQRTTPAPHSRFRPFSLDEADTVIRSEDLSKADVTDLYRDPSVLAAAPDMPVKLIAPVKVAAQTSAHNLSGSLLDNNLPPSPRTLQDDTDSTWGIKAVRADSSPYTGDGAAVAILDTGIDSTHERFAGVDIVTRNFTEDAEGHDIQGHGTHCAGTVFGQAVAGKPRIGVAPGVSKAIIGKVLGGEHGGGTTTWIAQGIQWAIEEGAQVISMSLGSDFHGFVHWLMESYGYTLDQAMTAVLDDYHSTLKFYEAVAHYAQARNNEAKQGAIIVAASGNGSQRFFPERPFEVPCGLPAAAENIISVGALGRIGDIFESVFGSIPNPEPNASLLTVAEFSSYNNVISAPGYRVLSSVLNGEYAHYYGTSMATPHVAGVAALWVERQITSLGRFDAAMLKYQLQGNASTHGVINIAPNLGVDLSDIGIGLVQAPQ